MIFDLHSHSNCSDGALAVDVLVACAIRNGVEVLSITDHDSVLAYQKLGEGWQNKINIIPGVEFSTQWNGVGIHVVGLNINPDSDAMRQGTYEQQQARKHRAVKIAEKLEKAGLDNAYSGAERFAGFGEVSRPHFARYMVEAGFCKNVEQAFRKYLGAGKMGDIKSAWADLATTIRWIKDAGGTAVLAHPHKYKMTRTKLLALTDAFKAAGGEAIEVLSGAEDKPSTATLAQLCQQRGLLASMGSDFHAPSSWSQLGMHHKLPAGCRPVWDRF